MGKSLEISNLKISEKRNIFSRKHVILNGISLLLNEGQIISLVSESMDDLMPIMDFLLLRLSHKHYIQKGSALITDNSGMEPKVIFNYSGHKSHGISNKFVSTISSKLLAKHHKKTVLSFFLNYLKNEKNLNEFEIKRELIYLFGVFNIDNPLIFINKKIHELSKLENWKISVIQSIIKKPKMLLLNNFLEELQIEERSETKEFLSKISSHYKMAVILFTDNLISACEFGSTIFVVYKGRIVEYGEKEEIAFFPQHPFTWYLVSSALFKSNEKTIICTPYKPINNPPIFNGDLFTSQRFPHYAQKLDSELTPQFFELSKSHFASTWLLSKEGPLYEPPTIIKERWDIFTNKYNYKNVPGSKEFKKSLGLTTSEIVKLPIILAPLFSKKQPLSIDMSIQNAIFDNNVVDFKTLEKILKKKYVFSENNNFPTDSSQKSLAISAMMTQDIEIKQDTPPIQESLSSMVALPEPLILEELNIPASQKTITNLLSTQEIIINSKGINSESKRANILIPENNKKTILDSKISVSKVTSNDYLQALDFDTYNQKNDIEVKTDKSIKNNYVDTQKLNIKSIVPLPTSEIFFLENQNKKENTNPIKENQDTSLNSFSLVGNVQTSEINEVRKKKDQLLLTNSHDENKDSLKVNEVNYTSLFETKLFDHESEMIEKTSPKILNNLKIHCKVGRPRKILTDEELNKPKRPRGRPRKVIDWSLVSLSKRKRGRPRKILNTSELSKIINRKPRGRPRKPITLTQMISIPKRPRGRPRKNLMDPINAAQLLKYDKQTLGEFDIKSIDSNKYGIKILKLNSKLKRGK